MKSVTPYNRLTSEEPIMDYAVVEQGVSATPVVEKKRFIEDTIRKEFEPWFGDLTPKEFITQLNHQIDSYNNHNDQESVDEILYMVLDKILVLMNIDCMFNCWTYDQFIKRYKGLLVYLQELFPNIYIRDIKNLLTTYLVQMQTIPALSNSDFGVAFLSNNEDYQYNLIDHIEHVIVPNYEKLPTNKEVHLDNEKNEVQSEVTTCICNNLDKIRLFCEKYHKNNKAVTAHGGTDNTATIGNNPGEKKVEFWINNKIIVEGRTSTRETPRTAVPAQDDDDDDDDTVDSKAIDIELGGGAKVVLPSSSPPSTVVVDHVSREEEKSDDTEDDKSDDDSLSIPTAYAVRSKKKPASKTKKPVSKTKKPASKTKKPASKTKKPASKNLKVDNVADAHVGDSRGRYDVDKVIETLLQRCYVLKNGRFCLNWRELGTQASMCFNAVPSNVSFLNGPLLVKDDEDDNNTNIAITDATVPIAGNTKTTEIQSRKNSRTHQKHQQLPHSQPDDVDDDDVHDQSIQQSRDGLKRKRKYRTMTQKEGEMEIGKKQKKSKTKTKRVYSLMTAPNDKINLPKQQRLITDQYIDQRQTSLCHAITEITNDPNFLINLSKEKRTSMKNCLVITEKLGGGMLTENPSLKTRLLTCMDFFSTLLKKVDYDNAGGGKDLPHPLYYSSVYVEDESVINKICYRMQLSPVQDRTGTMSNAYDNLSAIFSQHGVGEISMTYATAKNLADTLSRFIIVYAAWNINDNNNNRFKVETSDTGIIVSVSYMVDYDTTNNDDNNGNDQQCFTYESLLKWGRDAVTFIDWVLNNVSLFAFKSCSLMHLLHHPQITISNNPQLGEREIADGLKFAANQGKLKTTKTTKNTLSKTTVAKVKKQLLGDMSDLEEKVKSTLVESKICEKESDVKKFMDKLDLPNVAQNFPRTSNLLNSNSTGTLEDSDHANWLYHFTTLKSYLESNDNKYPGIREEHDLSKWIATQRFLYPLDYLSTDEIEKLNEIKFVWTDEDETEEEDEDEDEDEKGVEEEDEDEKGGEEEDEDEKGGEDEDEDEDETEAEDEDEKGGKEEEDNDDDDTGEEDNDDDDTVTGETDNDDDDTGEMEHDDDDEETTNHRTTTATTTGDAGTHRLPLYSVKTSQYSAHDSDTLYDSFQSVCD